jgi:hypothetical protein
MPRMIHKKRIIALIIAVILLSAPFSVLAINDVTINGTVTFELLTGDTAAPITVVAASGGLITNIDVQSNYLDITLDNTSTITLNTAGPGLYFNLLTGADPRYSATLNCPPTHLVLTGLGAQIVVRVEVITTYTPCTGGGGSSSVFPANYSLTINNGSTCTTSNDVNLQIQATNATQYIISNDPNFFSDNWQVFISPISRSWIFENGNGTKTVYMLLKSVTGDLSPLISTSINVNSAGCEIVPPQPPVVPPTPPVIPPVVPPSNLILHDPEPAQPLPSSVEIGQLVKRADISAVYFIDQDNRRHAFPNEATYFSWYTAFSDIQIISADTLASIPLGNNVTVRPGTNLIKIQSDPKVYAVEPYGVIRWVSSEQIANKLYGSTWNTKIVDVDVSFFVNYQVGANIESAVHPSGSVISYSGETATYYIENNAKRYLTPSVFSGDRFQDRFVIRNVGTDLIYTTGDNFSLLPIETLMTLR